MAGLTWIGGGDNRASNPDDWSPSQVPQPGDSLTVLATADNLGPFTMNVSGNDLAGDSLLVDGFRSTAPFDFTANLSGRAIMSADALFSGSHSTFNLSHQSTLTLGVDQSSPTVNLSQNSAAHIALSRAGVVLNISGNDAATISSDRGGGVVNLDPAARWSGTFQLSFGGLVVNGGIGSAFNNSGDSRSSAGVSTINADIIGHGSIGVGFAGTMEFVQSVGPNQSILTEGLVQIDRPDLFAADATLNPSQQPDRPSEIDLMGLANADGYSYKKDMLNILSGSKIIDTLRLHDNTLNGFVVEAPTAAGAVSIVEITDPTNPPVGLPLRTGV